MKPIHKSLGLFTLLLSSSLMAAKPLQPMDVFDLESANEPRISPDGKRVVYVRNFAEQIRAYVPNDYHVLGTDGFGRSDSRETLRRHFEVDRHYVTVAALKALADQQRSSKAKDRITSSTVLEAINRYGIDADKPNPLYA